MNTKTRFEWFGNAFWLLIISVLMLSGSNPEKVEASAKVEVPMLEDYDLNEAGRSEIWSDTNTLLCTTYRLTVYDTSGSPVDSVLVSVINNNGGEEELHLALYDQTYLIQYSHRIMKGGVAFNEIYCIKKGHLGDSVYYQNDNFWQYNTGYILLEKVGSKDAKILLEDDQTAILEGTGIWNSNFTPISKGAKTRIFKDGEIYHTYTWQDAKHNDNDKGLIYLILILVVMGAGVGSWFYRHNKNKTRELNQGDEEISTKESKNSNSTFNVDNARPED